MGEFEGEFEEFERNLLYDPQTSGGLLIAAPVEEAQSLLKQLHEEGDTASCIIGEVKMGESTLKVTR